MFIYIYMVVVSNIPFQSLWFTSAERSIAYWSFHRSLFYFFFIHSFVRSFVRSFASVLFYFIAFAFVIDGCCRRIFYHYPFTHTCRKTHINASASALTHINSMYSWNSNHSIRLFVSFVIFEFHSAQYRAASTWKRELKLRALYR